ncbi:hypothetical protein [Streptomyces spectabilis]|uniref:DUF3224 domain-containing protein n=1 Tax=Streptomyces spectabilis TaxID=68270 RepID=A0A516RJV1_STRST|nr:hypothetical protein [Streptomyces spectabilis]QDQ15923.1 hypothetical protein FH965_39675 [Streptomyces spectabilis]
MLAASTGRARTASVCHVLSKGFVHAPYATPPGSRSDCRRGCRPAVRRPAGAGARAGGGSITCQGGSLSAAFNPGVTFRKQTVQVQATGDLNGCASQEHPQIAGGTFRFVGSGTGSCPGPFAIGYGKMLITWNDGSTSTLPQMSFRAEVSTASVDGGVVSEGRFKGSTGHLSGRVTASPVEMGAQCITTGLTRYEAELDRMDIGES